MSVYSCLRLWIIIAAGEIFRVGKIREEEKKQDKWKGKLAVPQQRHLSPKIFFRPLILPMMIWLIDWLSDQVTDWLIDWLINWLTRKRLKTNQPCIHSCSWTVTSFFRYFTGQCSVSFFKVVGRYKVSLLLRSITVQTKAGSFSCHTTI